MTHFVCCNCCWWCGPKCD